jgi:hypothetical protein
MEELFLLTIVNDDDGGIIDKPYFGTNTSRVNTTAGTATWGHSP